MALAVAEVVKSVASRKTEDGVRMGLELERVRREQDLTQQQLAERLPMTVEGYRNYAKGYGRVTRNTLPKWAKALNVPIADLARRLGHTVIVCQQTYAHFINESLRVMATALGCRSVQEDGEDYCRRHQLAEIF